MATQANQDFLDYKHQRNILRRLVRKDLMEKQNAIALDYRNNPKRLWNYVKSKTKHREIIGDLMVIENNQEKTVTSNKDKAQALCDFFSSVFCKEPCDEFVANATRPLLADTGGLVLTSESVCPN